MTEKNDREFLPRKPGWIYQVKNDREESPRFFTEKSHREFLPRKIIKIFYREKLDGFTKKKMTEKSHRVFYREKSPRKNFEKTVKVLGPKSTLCDHTALNAPQYNFTLLARLRAQTFIF